MITRFDAMKNERSLGDFKGGTKPLIINDMYNSSDNTIKSRKEATCLQGRKEKVVEREKPHAGDGKVSLREYKHIIP
ncbi:unnamed protein product [Dovyalis caffra]|uniref:Uncharacterized protein n=1 Tax=Dovyalis caffra TaxID=77055 RepID=A0AAV1RTQ7_9ROSI|nr:unnamed protein product [Dovyalis caffra]